MASQDVSAFALPRPFAARDDGSVASARRGLLAYLAAVVALSAPVEGAIIATGAISALVGVLMWMPAVASIIVRLARHEGFADVSFRFGGRRTWWALLLGLLVPLIVGFVAYGTAWLTGLATFDPPVWVAGPDPVARFGMLLGLALTGNLAVGFILAAGEELGWRGYMLTRLIDGRIPHPVLVSGLIWGLWHTPLIATGLYAASPYPSVSVALFLVPAASLGVLIARARLATGSIWPAVWLHATWNAIIQIPFDLSTTGSNARLWVGESGILVAVILAMVAFLSTRGRWDESWRSRPHADIPAANLVRAS
jgi:uncharacterized protein